MSRAFLKDDAGHERVMVPQRAPLPDGVPNLVTPGGLAALEAEREALLAERAALQEGAADDAQAASAIAVLHERLADLQERIGSARVVPPPEDGSDEVQLGARVSLTPLPGSSGTAMQVRIVGVDEAEPLEGTVAFTAPLAAALLGRRRGDAVELEAGGTTRRWTIAEVRYP